MTAYFSGTVQVCTVLYFCDPLGRNHYPAQFPAHIPYTAPHPLSTAAVTHPGPDLN